MAYNEYANSGQSLGKVLYQLCKIGVPLNIVEEIKICQSNVILFNNVSFALYKWTEKDTPIFEFQWIYEYYNKLKQPKYFVLMGLDSQGNYNEIGVFEDVNSLNFKEKVSLYSKTYLADFHGKPLREQILNPTSFEDKFKRLKNKFSK